MEREGIKYIYIFFAEKYTRIGVILIIFSSVWFLILGNEDEENAADSEENYSQPR